MRLYQILIMGYYIIIPGPNYGLLYCSIRSSFLEHVSLVDPYSSLLCHSIRSLFMTYYIFQPLSSHCNLICHLTRFYLWYNMLFNKARLKDIRLRLFEL